MKVCTKCQREYPDEVKFCNTDGNLLISRGASVAATGNIPDQQVPLPEIVSDAAPPAPAHTDISPTQYVEQVKRTRPELLMAAWVAGFIILLCLGWLAIERGRSNRDYIKQPAQVAQQVSSASVSTPTPASAAGIAPQVALSTPKGKPASPFSSDPQDPTTVTNFGVPLVTELVSYGKNSPKVRAERIADRMNDCFLNDLVPPRTVMNMRQGILRNDNSGTKYVFFGYLHQGANHDTADIVATVDPVTAVHCKVAPVVLACWWRDILRDWLLIDHGQAPQYTIEYTPELKDFYNALPPESGTNTLQSDRFRKAVDTLINHNDEYERLRLLSLTVPRNYVAHPDNYSPALNDDGGPSTSG